MKKFQGLPIQEKLKVIELGDMHESKTKKLLKHLQRGKSISGIQAMNLFGLYRLSGQIRKLRLRGLPIVTKMVNEGKVRYASYSLSSKLKK